MDKALKVSGSIISVLYVIGVYWYVNLKWGKFLEMDPNAIGDFLAGSFSPLAFLWLVLGFYQQGKELRLQSEEMRSSVAQQIEMVKAQNATLQNHESSIQPILHLSVEDAGWDEYGFSLRLRLSNSGDYCDSLVVNITGADDFKHENQLQPLIGGSSGFVVVHDLQEWGDFNLVVHYKTKSGVPNSQSFAAFSYHSEEEGMDYGVHKNSFKR